MSDQYEACSHTVECVRPDAFSLIFFWLSTLPETPYEGK